MTGGRLPTRSEDPLGETLHLLRLQGVLYCQAELSAPWGIEIPNLEGCLSFQVVTQGRYLLEVDGQEPQWIERGSVVLLPEGRPHRCRSRPRVRAVPLDQLPVEPLTDVYERLDFGGGGATTSITYGVLRFDRLAAQRLLQALPPIILIDSFHSDIVSGWLSDMLRWIREEAAARRFGGEAMITRLADIVVIRVLRAWLDASPHAQIGWLAALRDPQLGRALAALHQSPARPWTLSALAKTAGMSRSAFSARFCAHVGESPMRYLSGWRMLVARHALRHTRDGLTEVAKQVGYATEAAFCKAFKREFGVTPGSVRA